MSSGVNGLEAPILEQLRLQEGRLFQAEKTHALYLDAKAVALESLSQAELDEDALEDRVKALKALAPKGLHEYHEKALHDTVKTFAKLLWPTQMLLVARPKLTTLLGGMHKRLLAAEPIKTATFAALDPFKQDFVVREAFRRTLVNDCLVVFEDEGYGAGTDAAGDDGVDDANWADGLNDVSPDDSASQAPPQQQPVVAKRPAGARSALGPIGEEGTSNVSASEDAAPAELPLAAEPSVAAPVAATPKSVVSRFTAAQPQHAAQRDGAASVAPRVVTVTGGAGGSVVASSVSHATGLSGASIMHKLNVRKVRITPDTEEST